MYLESKDEQKFAEWATKREAISIFGNDHEIVNFEIDETVAYDDEENNIEDITIDMTIEQNDYDEISAFTFTRTLSISFHEEDFKEFYKDIKSMEVA
jgi:triacylglycerol esterase/lipase EstA (alpha/beta hydrolase family)